MMGFASGSPGYGMMGYGYPSYGWGITDILVVILFIGLILLVYAHALGKLREGKEKRK
ncbi:TPA: sporulation protein YjcZ [Candidatus Micrarchaeota archaeon]|nr:sporulation protein YjcZ [Candidatus Micrarchaeota archaeon]HIH30255.1 sporulation protein YjcZ [Candidatus Micrarchaeota archaeon]